MNLTLLPSNRPTQSKFQLTLLALLFGVACGANGKSDTVTSDAGEVDGPTADAASPGDETAPAPGDSFGPLPGQEVEAGAAISMAPSPSVMPPNTEDLFSVGTNDAGVFEIWCGSALCACSDGLDNDEDGVSDGFDAECTGPFDDNETTFATGIPGDNRDPKWQDCFFDGNSGAGDDDCRYHTECLTGERSADDADCELTDQCVEYCQPLTPPGCDCFGCCEVTNGDTTVNVMLSETCSLDSLDDEGACPRCVPTDTCNNECGECELCLGQTIEDLPSSCTSTPDPGTPDGSVPPPVPGTDGGTPGDDTGEPTTPTTPEEPGNVCDNGEACTSSTQCDTGDYCRLGCCVPFQSNIR